MEYGSKEYNAILAEFKKGRSWLNDVSVDIPGDVNDLSPLVMLRAYEQEPTIDNMMGIASEMVLNKCVQFKRNGKIIHEFVYNGGDLGDKFVEAPFLLDLLLKLCYGILVKKLTPPSEDSETED